jgi:Tetratricopeptide repeat
MPEPNLEPNLEPGSDAELAPIATAVDRQDYRTAAKLLKPLYQDRPQDPWIQFYIARVQAGMGRPDTAESLYRKLLKTTTNARLSRQIRLALEQLQAKALADRQAQIAAALDSPEAKTLGCLVLKPLDRDQREQVGPEFARLMRLDPYTARLQLPGRGWRFYRTGPIAELQFYVEAFAKLGLPAFCHDIQTLKQLEILHVEQIQWGNGSEPHRVIGRVQPPQSETTGIPDSSGQLGHLIFKSREVSRRIITQLPIHQSVPDTDSRGRRVRTVQVQDYAQCCDLLLADRRCILRLCDRSYDFQGLAHQGVQSDLANPGQRWEPHRSMTLREKWLGVMQDLDRHLHQVQDDRAMGIFAETAADFGAFLEQIKPQLAFNRRDEDQKADRIYDLYSRLSLLQDRADRALV